jgi:hypothetical protein
MAGRIQENLNSAGVVVSIFISFFGFYYDHIRTSEAVDASLSVITPKSDNNSKLESATVDLLLLNKGDSPITVFDLWFDIDSDASTCCGRSAALKTNEDAFIVPILVPSMQASKITVNFI